MSSVRLFQCTLKMKLFEAVLLMLFLVVSTQIPSVAIAESNSIFKNKSTQDQTDWYDIPAESYQDYIAEYPQRKTIEYKQDFEVLLLLQANRNNEECRFGRYLKWPNFATFFAKQKPDSIDRRQLPVDFGVLLSEPEIEKYKPLMSRVMRYSSKVTKYYKELYTRPRPSRVDNRVQPCAEVPPGNTSYPSSHTAKGALVGCLLAEKFNQQENNDRALGIIEYGEYMGDLRAIIGVHHPSDVRAGKAIGYAICDRLLADESFRRSLEEL